LRAGPNAFHRRYESVSAPGQRLDEARCRRDIAKRVPDPVYGLIHAAIKINECVVAPEPRLHFFACHQLPRSLEQNCKKPKRLGLNADSDAALAEFAGMQINLENAKTDYRCSRSTAHTADNPVSIPRRPGNIELDLP
jgi:hypothetical protein